jgi:hypothetical protein
MNVKATTTFEATTEDGRVFELTANDCASIINAMSRCGMLCVVAESIPKGEYETIVSEETCAWSTVCDEPNEKVIISVDLSNFVSAVPVEKPKNKKQK